MLCEVLLQLDLLKILPILPASSVMPKTLSDIRYSVIMAFCFSSQIKIMSKGEFYFSTHILALTDSKCLAVLSRTRRELEGKERERKVFLHVYRIIY